MKLVKKKKIFKGLGDKIRINEVKNIDKNRRTKFLTNENSEKNMDNSSFSKFKTYHDRTFFARRINHLNPELKRLQSLEKGKEIIKNISKRFLKKNSLFITGFDGEVRTPFKNNTIKFRVPRTKLKSDVNILKNYNVFETEDDFIRKIMLKIYLHENIKKENEKKRRRMVLDKIYGFSPYHTQIL